MVTVTNYSERQRKDGTVFTVLELTGGVELVQNQANLSFYATVRRTTIPSTFSAEVAKTILGSQIPGSIVRVNVPAYDYTNKRTGEIMRLQHGFAYRPEGSMELIGETQINELELA